jgi:hypothetical protein
MYAVGIFTSPVDPVRAVAAELVWGNTTATIIGIKHIEKNQLTFKTYFSQDHLYYLQKIIVH